MSYLYLTADKIGLPTGGGLVTYHEQAALAALGQTTTIDKNALDHDMPEEWQEPWKWDQKALTILQQLSTETLKTIKLCHIYSGSFPDTVTFLKTQGIKVCYTIAAHDRDLSRQAHAAYGVNFDYQHLIQDDLWQRYIKGYQLADVIVCPSHRAARIVRAYPYTGRLEVIPHGCNLPKTIKPLPPRFTVGYLGSCGAPDKGVIYLLQAWKKLGYRHALLVLAGHDSTSSWVKQLVYQHGGGNVWLAGWQKNTSDFYNRISLYVQSSTTEGFGLEVLEALAHGRLALVSQEAGAADCVTEALKFDPLDVNNLAQLIDTAQLKWMNEETSHSACEIAAEYTWERVRTMYQTLWKDML